MVVLHTADQCVYEKSQHHQYRHGIYKLLFPEEFCTADKFPIEVFSSSPLSILTNPMS